MKGEHFPKRGDIKGLKLLLAHFRLKKRLASSVDFWIRCASAVLLVFLCGIWFGPESVAAKDHPKPKLHSKDWSVGRWQTFVLESGDQFRPTHSEPRPRHPKGELFQILALQSQLTPEMEEKIAFWDEGAITHRWSELLLEKIAQNRLNPVRASRAIALLQVAIYDAIIASWDAKFAYRLESPVEMSRRIRPLVEVPDYPSFPSEHSAAASAAAAVLSYLFPSDAEQFYSLAEEAGKSRVWAGANFPSDVEAGRELGEQVGTLVVERGIRDHSDSIFSGSIPTGPGFWTPPPSGALLEPMAGFWQTWILRSGSEVWINPPPPFGSSDYLAEVEEMISIAAGLTDQQKAIADFWADGAGTITPPGHWLQIAGEVVNEAYKDNPPRAARAMALVGVSVADAFITCWNYKYIYWTARPDQVIPGFVPYIRTPPFPGYPSGHSTQSGAASEVLTYLFPDQADTFRQMAEEAAISRLYGGIHFASDNNNGLVLGRKIGQRVIDYAREDGADVRRRRR